MFPFARAALLVAAGLAFPVAARADKPDDKKPRVEFRLAEDKPADGLTGATVEGTKDTVYMHKAAVLTSGDVAGAEATIDVKTADPAIEVRFNEAGAKKLAKLSEENTGRRLAIVVDGKVITAPVLRGKIGERAIITGRFTRAEAEKLAAAIGGK